VEPIWNGTETKVVGERMKVGGKTGNTDDQKFEDDRTIIDRGISSQRYESIPLIVKCQEETGLSPLLHLSMGDENKFIYKRIRIGWSCEKLLLRTFCLGRLF
jgi:hypothetical protein